MIFFKKIIEKSVFFHLLNPTPSVTHQVTSHKSELVVPFFEQFVVSHFNISQGSMIILNHSLGRYQLIIHLLHVSSVTVPQLCQFAMMFRLEFLDLLFGAVGEFISQLQKFHWPSSVHIRVSYQQSLKQ